MPRGYDIDETINAQIPGYKKRLKKNLKNKNSCQVLRSFDDKYSFILFLQEFIHFFVRSHKHDVLSMYPDIKSTSKTTKSTEIQKTNIKLNQKLQNS